MTLDYWVIFWNLQTILRYFAQSWIIQMDRSGSRTWIIGGDTMQLLGQQFPLMHITLHAFPSCCSVSCREHVNQITESLDLKLLSFSHVTEKKQLTFQSSRVQVVLTCFKRASFTFLPYPSSRSRSTAQAKSNPGVSNLELIAAAAQSTNLKKFFLK